MSAVHLAYHASAAQEAGRLQDAMQRLNYGVTVHTCDQTTPLGLAANEGGHVVLLINDDYLHALGCQLELIERYPQLIAGERLTPVLCSSRRQGPGNAEARVLTSLSRVSDVIRYMNYWQNAYLSTRRDLSARGVEPNGGLADVRRVSQEIGEVLRDIRKRPLPTVYELLDQENALAELLTERVGPPDPSVAAPASALEPTKRIDSNKAEASVKPVEPHETIVAVSANTTVPRTAHEEPTPEADDSVGDSPATVAPAVPTEVEVGSGAHDDEQALPVQPSKKLSRKKTRRATTREFRRLIDVEPEEAFAFAGRALIEDPGHDKLRYLLAIALLQRDEADHLDEARHHLAQLSDGKYGALSAIALGRLALGDRDYGSARRHLSLAYELAPEIDPELAYTLGALLQDEFPEREPAAIGYLKEATKRSQRNAGDAWYRLGTHYAAKGKLRRAARCLKTARALERAHPFAAYDLARVQLRRQRPGRAHKLFEEATRINPELDTETNRRAFKAPTPELGAGGFGDFVSLRDAAAAPQPALLDEPVPESTSQRSAASGTLDEPLTVLITGASAGIGRATARVFAKAGHRLVLTGRRVERLRELASELQGAHGTELRLLSFDVTDVKQANQLLGTLPEGWREIDVLINNAGKAKGLDFVHEGQLAHWEEMIDTNVKGLLYMTRLVSPGMVARGRGHIINVCSTAGHEVYPKGAVYCATKHAVDALTKGTRLDLHRYGIRVSQVSPAHVEETEFASVRFDGDDERASGVYEGFQPLRSSDVARAIYYVATEPAHVNVQDVLMLSTQQANSTTIARTGR